MFSSSLLDGSLANMALVITLTIVTVLLALHNYFYSYWERRGIKSPPVIPFIGSLMSLWKPEALHLLENNRKYGKVHGVYQLAKPILMISDPNLIKRVLVQDFNIFRNRSNSSNQESTFQKNLIALRDQDWKRIRSILSPMFTTSKLKKMESVMYNSIDSLVEAIEKKVEQKQPIIIRSITGNFTMDVIAKCAFATDTNAHSDKENPFIRNAMKFFDFSIIQTIVRLVTPKILYKILYKIHTPLYYSEANMFFKNLGFHLIEQRKKSEGKHFDDMLQLMVDARLGKDERYEKADEFDSFQIEKEKELFKDVIGSKYLSEEEIVAQSMIFFLAGYETTATTMAFCFYELAMNQDVQQKLFDEIRSVLHDGKQLNYSSVMTLPYLDAVLSETLRKYPPAILLNRQASEDYYFKEYDVTVEKDRSVMIPVYAIHHDPQYYPDPDRYDPERFMPENRDKIVPYTYLPFGGGPRNCIGMRFALTEAKLGIANLINSFRIVTTAKTPDKLRLTKSFFLLKTEPIYIGMEKRDVTSDFVYRYDLNSYWKRRGIKGAFVVPFFGNFITIFTPQPLNQLANSVKYGKVTGILRFFYCLFFFFNHLLIFARVRLFRGTSPMLMITDPKLIQRVLVKDFNYFRNRSPVPSRNQFVKDNFFSLRDEKWKRVRSIVSPTFSSHKLRKMSSIIDGCVRSIIKAVDRELVQKQEKSTIAIEKIFHNFGMDMCVRNRNHALNDQSNEDIFVINARKLFEFDILGLVLSIILPEFIQDIFVKLRLPHFYQESNEFFRKIATKLIANRKANPNEKHDDLLQLMINARLRDNDNDNEEGKKEEVSDSSSINRLSDNFQLNLGLFDFESAQTS
ncbi:cytochrome P450-like protein 24 [Sarcoptes scabiei]|uniref:Cytochrome P450-like protein 24 n=1 Tax=Sarcoptes scabiei TaxID=52283 RepID=A0A132AJI3_SARSC|nr:cytochrome P450-like protein 24 [Sarcoptes scabiei]